jgi:uncharacterized membrane protein
MRSVAGAAVLAWLGIMVFFAFVVAPAAFATLEREAAGRFVSAMFPRYYLVGTVLGAVAVVAAAVRGAVGGWRHWDWVALGLTLLMLALTLYAWGVVLPAAHTAREAMKQPGAAPAEAATFARLHRLSGILNGAVMAAGVLLVLAEAARPRAGAP